MFDKYERIYATKEDVNKLCDIVENLQKSTQQAVDKIILTLQDHKRRIDNIQDSTDNKYLKALNETTVKYNKLCSVVKFYADKSNYFGTMSKVWEDGGELARKSLEEVWKD